MSKWTEDYTSHPIHADITALKNLLGSDELRLSEPKHAEEISRLRKVVTYCEALIREADPELVESTYLSGMHTYVQNILSEVTTYSQNNNNAAHLQNANSYVDAWLSLAIRTPFTALAFGKNSLGKAVTNAQDTISKYVASVHAETQKALQDTKIAANAVKADIGNNAKAVEKLDSRIGTSEQAVQAQLTEFNNAFQQSETTRTQRFDQHFQAISDKADNDFIEVVRKQAIGLVALSKMQDDAKEVLGVVINTAQAGAYASYANEEKASADKYRAAAITAMAVAALFMLLPELLDLLRSGENYTVDWQRALMRLPFSLIVFFPALYLAKQSDRHRTNEVVNRRRQHILTTIQPYLALLPDDKSEQIRADVARSIFSETSTGANSVPDELLPSNILTQLASLYTAVLNSVKKGS